MDPGSGRCSCQCPGTGTCATALALASGVHAGAPGVTAEWGLPCKCVRSQGACGVTVAAGSRAWVLPLW